MPEIVNQPSQLPSFHDLSEYLVSAQDQENLKQRGISAAKTLSLMSNDIRDQGKAQASLLDFVMVIGVLADLTYIGGFTASAVGAGNPDIQAAKTTALMGHFLAQGLYIADAMIGQPIKKKMIDIELSSHIAPAVADLMQNTSAAILHRLEK